MGSGKTTFKKTVVARIVDGIKASKANGIIEFELATGVIKFYIAGEIEGDGQLSVNAKNVVNPWDKVLKNGKAKPALTVIKKVP